LSHKQARIARKRFKKQKRQEFTITPAFIASLPIGNFTQEVSR